MRNNSLNYKKSDKAFNTFICVLLCLIIAFAAFRIFFAVNYFGVCVDGASMEGTLYDGDCLYAMRSSDPKRGDIVIIDRGDKIIIKRVIALGGDTVELKAGVLYLNGEKVDEPYVDSKNNTPTEPKNTFSEITVPEGKMVFMGDNRDNSSDCRHIYDSKTSECIPMETSKIMGIVADWSLSWKGALTKFNNFFGF